MIFQVVEKFLYRFVNVVQIRNVVDLDFDSDLDHSEDVGVE